MEEGQRHFKALQCHQLGNPTEPLRHKDSPLRLVNLPSDSLYLPPNGVRIRVVAAGVNFADLLQMQGQVSQVAT